MKIILLNILFISTIFAQSGLTVVGGLNQSNQTFEEDDVGDENINYLNGYNLTVEKSFGIAKFGVGLNQRGVKLNAEESDMGISLDMEAELTLNYLTLHAVYPYAIQEKITVFGGVQLGKGLGGEANMKMSMSVLGETESSDDSEDIDAEDDETKNNTISVSLLFKLQFKKVNIKPRKVAGFFVCNDDDGLIYIIINL